MNGFDTMAQAELLRAESNRQMGRVMLWVIRAGFARLGRLLFGHPAQRA